MPSPSEGGCRFCQEDGGNLVFDEEFDTYVHLTCIRRALEDARRHGTWNEEAELMAYLLVGDN